MIIATVFSVIFISKKEIIKFKPLIFYFPLIFFCITIISSLTSKNVFAGLKRTDLEFLPIMIVILLLSKRITKNMIKQLFFVFYLSTAFFTLILILISVYNIYSGNSSGTFHNFTSPYDQHPVYFAIYISISLCYLLIYQKTLIFKGHLIFKIVTIFILVYGLVLSASKAVLFFNFIIFFLYVFMRYEKIKERLIGLSLLLIFFVFVSNNTLIKDRFTNGLTLSSQVLDFTPTDDFSEKKIFSYDEKKNISDLELRYIFSKIAIFHIYNDHKIVFGYGQGDVQNYLDYYFYSYNLAPNWYDGYNIHNQYLHILITYGIFVLIMFLWYIGFSLYIAIINRNYLYLFFILICSFVFLFEVILVRNKGIIFFYFFNTLFLTHYLDFENSNIRNKRYTKLSWWF
ncbi:MAG: O-antigen ligase family protein [Winogradskyella wichelsiae]|uniref:O-antigen ligase family protein n=1 Tax=Winogradskyella wichelsiae TaxID=2697007 RepID=UPI0015CA01AA|nr:O-antigen ligase family protein [Winogradskyella wichelsiae]